MDLAASLTSREGMSTNVWGNPLWFVLHIISMAFPLDDGDARRAGYRQFMESLADILPCGACRDNYAGNYRDAVEATHRRVGHGPYESRGAFITSCGPTTWSTRPSARYRSPDVRRCGAALRELPGALQPAPRR